MPAGSHRFQVGTLSCTVLSDGYVANPPGWCFPNADPAELAATLRNHRMPEDRIVSPYACLLVETGRHVVLIDAGLGSSSPTAGAIPARLETVGVRLRDVDTVILTHAHPDHLGGAVCHPPGRGAMPAFPNARYVIAEKEWDFWMASRVDLDGMKVDRDVKLQMQETIRGSLLALRHQADLLDRDAEIVPGIWTIDAPGHTPGHLAVLLQSEGKQVLNLGDAAVHPCHLEHPEWQNGFDSHPAKAIATRRSLLERAAAERMGVMAFHFPFPSVGRIETRPAGGWNWMPGW